MFARILLRPASHLKRLSVVAALCAVGCVNVSTLQTARVLPPGDQMIVVGGGTSTFAVAPADVTLENGGLKTTYVGEVLWRIGVLDGLDVGAHVTMPGTSSVDAKYQFMDMGPLAVAAGLSIGGLQITSSGSTTDAKGNTTTTESKFTIVDVLVPVYVSYDFMEALTGYISPKFLVRNMSGSGTFLFAGGTGGIKVGDGIGLMLEASYLKGINDGANDSRQINAGIYWSR